MRVVCETGHSGVHGVKTGPSGEEKRLCVEKFEPYSESENADGPRGRLYKL